MKILALLLCLTAIPVAAQTYSRVEVGPVFSTLFINKSLNQYQPELGGRVTFNFSRLFAIDSELTSSLVKQVAASNYDGGYALHVVSGAKVTARRKSFAVFAKARPGLLSYSGAFKSLLPAPPFYTTQRIGLFTIDVGGGVEFFAGRRLGFRYDFGDLIVWHPALTGTFPVPAQKINNFQFETAVAYRF